MGTYTAGDSPLHQRCPCLVYQAGASQVFNPRERKPHCVPDRPSLLVPQAVVIRPASNPRPYGRQIRGAAPPEHRSAGRTAFGARRQNPEQFDWHGRERSGPNPVASIPRRPPPDAIRESPLPLLTWSIVAAQGAAGQLSGMPNVLVTERAICASEHLRGTLRLSLCFSDQNRSRTAAIRVILLAVVILAAAGYTLVEESARLTQPSALSGPAGIPSPPQTDVAGYHPYAKRVTPD